MRMKTKNYLRNDIAFMLRNVVLSEKLRINTGIY